MQQVNLKGFVQPKSRPLNTKTLKSMYFAQERNPRGQNPCTHIINKAPTLLANLVSKSKGLEAGMFVQRKDTEQTPGGAASKEQLLLGRREESGK